ncbi:MAG: UpxY family transcription antiterminator [Rikenellaceae bacterium]
MGDVIETNWYVIKVRFNRTLIAQELLTKLGVEAFLPMELRTVVTKGRKVQQKLMPMVANMIFINTTLQKLKDICAVHKFLVYSSHKVENRYEAMVVPDYQMQQFRDFVEGNYEHIDYIDASKVNFTKGERVRITSGVFKDKEALFVRVQGKRSKQAVVQIGEFVVAVTKSEIKKDMLEVIE